MYWQTNDWALGEPRHVEFQLPTQVSERFERGPVWSLVVEREALNVQHEEQDLGSLNVLQEHVTQSLVVTRTWSQGRYKIKQC